MDAQTAQLRHQIDQTRAALDATLTQLAPHASQMPAVRREPHVLGPARGIQETTARATTLLSPYPWLIMAAMALVGYQLHRAKTRPARPVPPPPPRAAVTPPRESPVGTRQADHLRGTGEPHAQKVAPPGPGESPRAAPPDPRPSLVFMDVHLPGAMDSWQAAAHIWAQWCMPIISLTR
jgi:hypothetical protein